MVSYVSLVPSNKPGSKFRLLFCCNKVSLNPILRFFFGRVRKRVKSNEELRNEILEFVALAGLPPGHVPSMKELSAHQRFQLSRFKICFFFL